MESQSDSDSNKADMSRTLKVNYICYVLLLATYTALPWLLPYFPTQDGPSHMYNLVILRDLLNGGKDWGFFYTCGLQATPNLGFHFLAYPLLSFFSPIAVEKIFLSFYLLLMGISIPVFLRTFSGSVFPFAYLVFPVLFNFCIMMGFYSYSITIPLFFLAVSTSWRLRNYSFAYKILPFNVMGIVLFYFHLIPAVLYMMALVVIELLKSPALKKKLADVARLIIIVTPSFANYIFYWSRNSSLSRATTVLPNVPYKDLLRDFFTFSTVSFDPVQEKLGILILAILVTFLCIYLYDKFKKFRDKGIFSDLGSEEKFLLFFLVGLVLIYLFMPFSLGGEGSYFNQRFPWVIFLLTLPLLRLPSDNLNLNLTACSTFVVVAILFFIVNIVVMHKQSLEVEKFLQGTSVKIAKGSYLMFYREKYSEWSRVDVLQHAASYYGMAKGCVDISNYEATTRLFPVQFRDTLPLMPSRLRIASEPEKIEWQKYPSINYILGWKVLPYNRGSIDKYFTVVFAQGPLSLWCSKSKRNECN